MSSSKKRGGSSRGGRRSSKAPRKSQGDKDDLLFEEAADGSELLISGARDNAIPQLDVEKIITQDTAVALQEMAKFLNRAVVHLDSSLSSIRTAVGEAGRGERNFSDEASFANMWKTNMRSYVYSIPLVIILYSFIT
jgi:hypothetical protein